ncbi:Prefoldin subunit 5 [Cichlidogyrus casuarinus]|uniref:Prefoldin subunit 5 n=1 Tax=Cichlidogyrus casuarinus TaxID=1844966 RepID=A0ABD2QRA2_9PLAT
MSEEEKSVPLSSLPLGDLSKLHEQSKSKSEFLATAMMQFRDIRSKFGMSLNALNNLESKMDQNISLIPLTTNLYVPGKLKDPSRVIVSIGTGYYAEMSVEQAKKFVNKRISFLTKQLDELAEANFQALMVAKAAQQTIESKAKAMQTAK